MGVGSYYARRIAGDPFDDEWADRIAAAMLRLLAAGGDDGKM